MVIKFIYLHIYKRERIRISHNINQNNSKKCYIECFFILKTSNTKIRTNIRGDRKTKEMKKTELAILIIQERIIRDINEIQTADNKMRQG